VSGEGKGPPRVTRHAPLGYGLALVFFALGLMSKAMLVTLPFLLLLLDIWPFKRVAADGWRVAEWKKLVVEKWPFFALTAVFCVVTFLVQRGDAATPSLQELGLGLRLENIVVSYLRYLGWTLWPANLAMFYSFPYDRHFYLALWPGWQITAGALLLAAVSALVLTQIRRRPYLAVGWFWYLGTMVPVIGLVQVGSQGMADRYTYLPLIGPVISLVWLVTEKWPAGRFSKGLLASLTAVILAASIFQTRHQLQFWKNTESLCRHTIAVTGENPQAEYISGLGLEHEGRLEEAMSHYRNAVSSQPRVKAAFPALGRLLARQGNWTLAEQAYATMLGDDPNDFAAHLGLATTLPHLGREAEAEAHLKTARENCPDTPDALNNLAWTLATSPEAGLRDGARAVELASRACALTGYRETIMVGTLGAAYAEAGRFEEAVATAQKACALAAAAGKTELLKINQQLLESYRQHQPYREPAGPEQK
jgi:tetratricopeptide (TPR) repeat protein